MRFLACSFRLLARMLNIRLAASILLESQISLPSTYTTPSNTGPSPQSTRSLSLVSILAYIPEMHHCVHTVRPNKNGTSICKSGQKLNCTPEFPRTRMSLPSIHHQFQLYSSTQDIPVQELPPSIFDAVYFSCNSNTSHIQDFGLLLPTTHTHVNYVSHFFVPSSLQSLLDDILT